MEINRGDIFFANLDPVKGSEQGGYRPVVVIQNNLGNKYSPTIVAAVTSRKTKKKLPTHVEIKIEKNGNMKKSIVLLEQIRTIDRQRLLDYVGKLTTEEIEKINEALLISLGI